MSTHPSEGVTAGHELFLEHLSVIEAVIARTTARHRMSGSDSEDFASEVRLKLLENNCAALRQFRGASRLATFLSVVVERFLLDYRNKLWGKWRPSAEAVRLGETAVLLERATARDGHSFEEACEVLAGNPSVRESRQELEAVFIRLPRRTRRRFESDDTLASVSSGDASDRDVEREHLRSVERRVADVIVAASRALDLQDRLILTMRFEDGRKVSEIAAALGLDAKSLYRRVERLLDQLRREIERAGIPSSEVQELLGEQAVVGGWFQGEPENAAKVRL